jgi:biopolymer transport protein ExbB
MALGYIGRYRELLEARLDEAVLKELPAIERGQGIIKLLAGVAPLLGLLGTVTGMIATFQAITAFGSGDAKLMASGISQALITTVLGLVVAIPLLLMHSWVASRSRTLVQILDEQSAGLIAQSLEKTDPKNSGKSS